MISAPLATLVTVQEAAARIKGRVRRTPLIHSGSASRRTGFEVFLKAENLQKTGSFKPRGALNKILQLTPGERARGVLAASAGNHAQGLAWAARAEGIPVRVVMPEKAQPAKIAATRGYGAVIDLHGSVFHDALARSLEIQRETGMTYVHPCTDPMVAAGAGTIGLEILEDLPEVQAVIVPIGGGALLSGIAAAIRGMRPDVRVFGVEASNSPAMKRSLDAGGLVTLDSWNTIADGMAGPSTFQETLDMCREWVEDVLLVSEEGMLEAISFLLTRDKLLSEGAGAAPLAALLEDQLKLPRGSRVVALISGGNQDLGLLAGWLEKMTSKR